MSARRLTKGAPLSARSRVLLDLALLGVLLVAYNPSWTGLALHEWLCAAALVPLLAHLVINWEQTMRLAQRFAEHRRHTPRVNLIVYSALFFSAVGVTLSGFTLTTVMPGRSAGSWTPRGGPASSVDRLLPPGELMGRQPTSPLPGRSRAG